MNVWWLSYYEHVDKRGYWDQAMLEDYFCGNLWPTGKEVKFNHYENVEDVPEGEGAVVVLAGQFHTNNTEQLNQDFAKLAWVVLIITADEGALFPTEKINHPKLEIYHQTPRNRAKPHRSLLVGYPPGAPGLIAQQAPDSLERPLDFFFAGQITHERRKDCAEALKDAKNGLVHVTDTFRDLGKGREWYYKQMTRAKVVPAPAGPATPDSFRFAEALEAGCIPVADSTAGEIKDYPEGYWEQVVGKDAPFPVIGEWSDFHAVLKMTLAKWPSNANQVFAWWIAYKRRLAWQLTNDIEHLSGTEHSLEPVTVLMPTSPSPFHPETEIIEATVDSIRERLPNAEIIIMADGVRKEQQHLAKNYEEYLRRLLWKSNHEWHNVLPILFEENVHQAAMTRVALEQVKTPYILFCEHDTPLCEDIPFDDLLKALNEVEVDVIRLYPEGILEKEHKHLFLDKKPVEIAGVPFVRTTQWSQRPHLAKTWFYEELIEDNFVRPNGTVMRTYVEYPMHSAAQVYPDMYRVAIYHPEGHIKRSVHVDARGREPVYETEPQ